MLTFLFLPCLGCSDWFGDRRFADLFKKLFVGLSILVFIGEVAFGLLLFLPSGVGLLPILVFIGEVVT